MLRKEKRGNENNMYLLFHALFIYALSSAQENTLP